MSEIIGTITNIEDDSYQGKDFKKVTLGDGSILKVKYGREGTLKAKWGELQVGRAYSWVMGEYKDKPFVQDFNAVELPQGSPAQSVPTPDQPEINASKPIAPQEMGMWFKEIGDCWRNGFLVEDDQHPVEKLLIKKYKDRMCEVMGIQAKEIKKED